MHVAYLCRGMDWRLDASIWGEALGEKEAEALSSKGWYGAFGVLYAAALRRKAEWEPQQEALEGSM